MPRINDVFAGLRAAGQGAFLPFLVAGDPDLATTAATLRALDQAGCHFCEVGFPFSDPIADGPVIQSAYTRALTRGLQIEQVFGMLEEITPQLQMPLVAMVSFSLVYRRGVDSFVERAARSGLAGLIVPDLPVEEAADLRAACEAKDLDLIQLITPTTPPDRAAGILALARGFVYCVSVAGVTGERRELPVELFRTVESLKRQTSLPVCVGFGISEPEQARALRGTADGVIVGSALVRQMERLNGDPLHDSTILAELADWCRSFIAALANPATHRS